MTWRLMSWSTGEHPIHRMNWSGLFIDRLKETLEIPILDEWAAVLWKQANDRNFVENLTTGGDCSLGARIDLQAGWQELLTDLLLQEELSLTV